MFLQLDHQKLDVYHCSRNLAVECYKLSRLLPESERYGLVRQIRRAATSVTLNIAEGCSRKSTNERTRYFEISRGSVNEIDAILDLAYDLGFLKMEEMQATGVLLIRAFKMLSKMIK